jgi:hypothetical protein
LINTGLQRGRTPLRLRSTMAPKAHITGEMANPQFQAKHSATKLGLQSSFTETSIYVDPAGQSCGLRRQTQTDNPIKLVEDGRYASRLAAGLYSAGGTLASCAEIAPRLRGNVRGYAMRGAGWQVPADWTRFNHTWCRGQSEPYLLTKSPPPPCKPKRIACMGRQGSIVSLQPAVLKVLQGSN